MAQTKLTITHDKDFTVDVQNQLIVNSMTNKMLLENAQNILKALNVGMRMGTVAATVDDGNAVTATGTLTLASVVATNTATVNSVVFTGVASGATGNQFNIGGTDTITAANLAAAINASTTPGVAGAVTATSAGAVVTVSSATPGLAGNGYTISGGQATITASGAKLTGGLAATTSSSVTYKFGV